MDLIGVGRTAEIYSYSKNKIVKLFFDNYKENVEKEFKINKIIQNKLDNTARVYERKQINNREGIIFDKIKGKSLLGEMFEKYEEVNNYMKLFYENQKVINNIEIHDELERYEDEILKLLKTNSFLNKK